MFNTINNQYKFQTPKNSILRLNKSVSPQTMNAPTHQIKDVISFGKLALSNDGSAVIDDGCNSDEPKKPADDYNSKNDYFKEKSDKEGIPPETYTPTKNRTTSVEDVKAHMAKLQGVPDPDLTYKKSLKEILQGNSTDKKAAKKANGILTEVMNGIKKSGNRITIEKMNKEIKTNMLPYLYVDDEIGSGEWRNPFETPHHRQLSALAKMIGNSELAKKYPKPWVPVLAHMMNDKVLNCDRTVKVAAAEALYSISTPEDKHIFEKCRKNNNGDPNLEGICSAGIEKE